MPPTTTLPADAISLAAAAQLLGVAPCSMWRWAIRDGKIRAWRIGGRWKVSKTEALSLVKMNAPRPDVVEREAVAARLEEVDAILRAEGVRR